MRLNYAIIFVSDMKRSIAFYRDVVGMPLRFESPDWTEFATEGATIALHKSEATEKPSPTKESAGWCRPGVTVPGLTAFHQRMIEYKVPCVQEPKNIFGALIAQYVDPDGLAFGVSEDRKMK